MPVARPLRGGGGQARLIAQPQVPGYAATGAVRQGSPRDLARGVHPLVALRTSPRGTPVHGTVVESPSPVTYSLQSPVGSAAVSSSPPPCSHPRRCTELLGNGQLLEAFQSSSSQRASKSPPASRLALTASPEGEWSGGQRCLPQNSLSDRGWQTKGGSLECLSAQAMPSTLRAGNIGSQSERTLRVGSPPPSRMLRQFDQVPSWAMHQSASAGPRQLLRLRGEQVRLADGNVEGHQRIPGGPSLPGLPFVVPPGVFGTISPIAPTDPHDFGNVVTPPFGAASTVLVETDANGYTSPSSTIDLHGPAGLSINLGRTPSAPDSLLSGNGGLDLSNSVASHPSLTISSNSNASIAKETGPSSCYRFISKETGPSESKKAAGLVSPTVVGRFVPSDPVVAPAQEAQPLQASDSIQCEAPKSQPRASSPPPLRATAVVGDENTPPHVHKKLDTDTIKSKEAKLLPAALAAAGRSEVVTKMRSYWEQRTLDAQVKASNREPLGSSPRRLQQRSPRKLRDGKAEQQRFIGQEDHCVLIKSNSASLARHADSEKRRIARRLARQKELQDNLSNLFQSLCPEEAEEMEVSMHRSSGSESEPSSNGEGCKPRKQRVHDEGDEWCRVLESENRSLWKIQRQTLQMLTGYLKTRRSATCWHISCPRCTTPLSCPQCAAGAALDTITALRAEGSGGEAFAAFEPKTMEASSTRDFPGLDEDDASAEPLSPMPSTVQEEEPAQEPDSGMLCP